MTQRNSAKGKKRRKKPEKLEFVQDFIPIKELRHGIIETTDGRYIKILEIEPINFMLRSDDEQFSIISTFASWLKISPIKLQFKSITRRADSDKHVAMVREELEAEPSEECKHLGEDYINLIKDVGSREALTRRFFLIFQYEEIRRNETDDFSQIYNMMQTAEQNARAYFMQCGNNILQPEDSDEATAEILYKDNGDTQIETEEAGAEFEVYLKSAGSYENAKETERAYLITDEWGYAETNTLPYGVYAVKQVKGSEGFDLMKPFDVFISEPWTWQQFIINNAPFTSYVKIQKTDAESGLAIPYAGAAFQIYNPDGTKVSMEYTYPEHTVIDTFYTNEDGYLITPETLGYGKGYYLVEMKAPYGYVLNSDPVYFDVTADDATEEGGLTIVNVTRSNMPQKGVIHITKTGEVFQSVVITNDMHKPVYEIKVLAGAVFEIRAAEDIYTLDGVMHYAKGELVDTITTGSDGIATSKELYLGKYDIQEVTAPHSMVLNGKVQTVELVYAGQEISITETSGNLYNERQKVKVSLEKALEQNELFGIGMNAELKNITFGLYAQTDILAADGSKIPAGGLIEIIAFDETGKAVISTDLPLGSYYVQERSTDDHYILSDEKYGFEFTYGEQTIEVIELAVNNGAAIENELKYGSASGLKLDEDGKVIKGAVFGLFSNDENEYTRENAYMVTESAEDGTFKFENIPYGTWVVREIETAVGFVLNEKAYQITIKEDGDVVEIKLENRYIRGDIEGLKLDEDGNVIAGAKFGLFKPGTTEFTRENAVLVTESDSEGKFRFEDIRFGKWIVRELVPATGNAF